MTAERPAAIEYTPPTPATLKIDGREIAVDESPAAVSVDALRLVKVLSESPDELVVGTDRRTVTGAAALATGVVAGGVGLTLLLMWDAPTYAMLIPIVIGLGIAAAMVRAALRSLWRLRFDRRAGRLACEYRAGFAPRMTTSWELPLGKVVAVQLLYNGSHTVTETLGAGEQQLTTTRRYYGYEINLVLDDSGRRRVNLYSCADWESVRQTGNRIGTFLGVPVIDKLHHGG